MIILSLFPLLRGGGNVLQLQKMSSFKANVTLKVSICCMQPFCLTVSVNQTHTFTPERIPTHKEITCVHCKSLYSILVSKVNTAGFNVDM